MKRITVSLTTGDIPQLVPGYAYDSNWAIHRHLPSTGMPSEGWTITHIHTGLRLGFNRPTRRECAWILSRILADTSPADRKRLGSDRRDIVAGAPTFREAFFAHRFDFEGVTV